MGSEWKKVDAWEEIEGLDCVILLQQRPAYCDRGNFLAQIMSKPGGDPVRLNIDHQDGWPRYYMDRDNAHDEIELWLMKRKQWINA